MSFFRLAADAVIIAQRSFMNKRNQTINRSIKGLAVVLAFIALGLTGTVFAAFFGAIYTTLGNGMTVNQNIYSNKADVYLNGGPQNTSANGLPNGTYYYQVTSPNGILLSEDNAICRQVVVAGGYIMGDAGDPSCNHANGTANPVTGALPVQLIPFADTYPFS
jgi:hypothetical protein